MAFGDLSAKQHLNFQFRYFGNCLDVDTLIILHIKDHKIVDNIIQTFLCISHGIICVN